MFKRKKSKVTKIPVRFLGLSQAVYVRTSWNGGIK